MAEGVPRWGAGVQVCVCDSLCVLATQKTSSAKLDLILRLPCKQDDILYSTVGLPCCQTCHSCSFH